MVDLMFPYRFLIGGRGLYGPSFEESGCFVSDTDELLMGGLPVTIETELVLLALIGRRGFGLTTNFVDSCLVLEKIEFFVRFGLEQNLDFIFIFGSFVERGDFDPTDEIDSQDS